MLSHLFAEQFIEIGAKGEMVDTVHYTINGAPIIEAETIDLYPRAETKSCEALAIFKGKFLSPLMVVSNTHTKIFAEINLKNSQHYFCAFSAKACLAASSSSRAKDTSLAVVTDVRS